MKLSKVHYLTQDGIPGMSHAALAEAACRGGADWVQFRMKSSSNPTVEAGNNMLALSDEAVFLKETALAVQAVCKRYGATFIINDNVALAKEIKADGVHIGKNDMRPDLAREELGENFIIGATANTLEDAKRMASFDIDYLGVGPFKFTTTKEKLAPVLGAEGIAEIVQALPNIPIIAIGGIVPEDIEDVMKTGVHGLAICSVVNTADDRSEKMKEILVKVDNVGAYCNTPLPESKNKPLPESKIKPLPESKNTL